MNSIEIQLSDRLSGTFQQYFRHAVEHALNEEANESDVLQVIINIQASLELLSKLYVLKKEGWKSIITPRFHNRTESEVISAIENGTIITIPYGKNKNIITKEIYLNEDDKLLLKSFQNRRNQVMHLGMVAPSKKILDESIWLIVRIINQMGWQDTLPARKQYMSNSLEFLLGKDLYNKLITTSCYVGEAVDMAYELYEDTKPCIQCGNESWALNEDDYRICLVCGYRGHKDAFGFIDCPKCNSQSTLIYDPLNIGSNTFLYSKCCACGEIVQVAQCSECKNIYEYPSKCWFCKNEG